jgi:hypothetical protein
MSPKGEEKPYLQGWAVVENPSDEDWKDVRMVLVSGRPISFQMDLYQPLYVQRPTVVPELFQGLRPVAYSGSMRNGMVLEVLNDADDPAPAKKQVEDVPREQKELEKEVAKASTGSLILGWKQDKARWNLRFACVEGCFRESACHPVIQVRWQIPEAEEASLHRRQGREQHVDLPVYLDHADADRPHRPQ